MSNSFLKNQSALTDIREKEKFQRELLLARHPECDPKSYILRNELDMLKQCVAPECNHVFCASEGVLYTAEWRESEDGESFFGTALFCSLECVLTVICVEGQA